MNLKEISKKQGTLNTLRQYKNAHSLFYSLFMTLFLGLDKKAREILRMAVKNKLLKRLRRQYNRFIKEFKSSVKIERTTSTEPRKIWICWFQDFETNVISTFV